jgi:hypothetical protein
MAIIKPPKISQIRFNKKFIPKVLIKNREFFCIVVIDEFWMWVFDYPALNKSDKIMRYCKELTDALPEK